ncbi:MAG TPA: putative toxin-antitoxin system toxin component, PIN family [Candidatus Eisenbacteria bacterium]
MTVRPAVIDTNVLVSGLLTRLAASPTVRIVEAMLAARFRYALSIDLLAEYRSVLLRPRIRSRHGLSEAEVDVFLVDIAANGFLVPVDVEVEPPSQKRERGDEHLWRLMGAVPTAVLVTGDKRLAAHELGSRVVSAREFVDRLEG